MTKWRGQCMRILKNKIEHNICKTLGFNYGKITNNGSEAIKYCLMNAKIKKGTYIIVPITICKSVVDVILEYGCFPLFVDVDQDFCLNINDVVNKNTDNISTVIYVHAYGILKDVRALVKYCNDCSICLIEDSAQYICNSNRYMNCPQGDFVIYSFGKGKPVDIGGLGFIASNIVEITEFPLIQNFNLCKNLNKCFTKLNNILKEKKDKAKKYKNIFANLNIIDNENFLDNIYHRLLVHYPQNYYRISEKMYLFMNAVGIDNYQSTIPIEAFREKSIKAQLPKPHQSLNLKDFPTYSKLKKSIHYFRTTEWINDENIALIGDKFIECVNDDS